ncbi:ROK family transcriptional regulator [Streptomyces albidoflavus]|uniref:ROK family transcriptional regulator n=1 Tax=Streptomyces albidoflavus TaxID=1886 RepID=UPI0033A779DE
MPASPRTARVINDRLALDHLLREGPLTAARLKELTGLSRPTVADLVERLTGAGLIRVVGESGADRRGPNARLYGLVAERAHLAALDVRTSGLALVVTDLLGTPLAEARLPIDGDLGTVPAVERAVSLLDATLAEAGVAELHSVCVGAPGLVDPATGELRDSTGLPGWHRRLVRALQGHRSARVLVENETNLAAVAERRHGAAQDHDTFVLLWLGHGVGAALVLDGTLRRGAGGGAGEIGFLPVPLTSSLPSATDCGGGFHSLAGAAAVHELARRHGVPVTRARDDADGREEPASATAVRAAFEAGTAGELFLDELADRIALGAAAVAAVLDPGCVVLAGETGEAGGEALAARVGKRLAALSPLRTDVRPTRLGGTAVLTGALLTAQEDAREAVFPAAS